MRRGRPRHDDILTPREWQVLRLIRDGLTNEQIAGRLGISLSAAKYHVSEILSKLEVSSRQEAASHVEDPKRGVLAVLPVTWLQHPLTAGRRTGITVATGAGAIALVVLALLLVAPWSRGGLPGDELASADSPLGPDLATEGLEEYEQARLVSPYQHTVLVAQTLPSDYSPEDVALLQSLPRVSSLAHLQAVLTPQISLIVVDSSVAAEFEDNDFLYQQLQAGRAVMELNVCLDQIHFRGPVRMTTSSTPREVTEIAPDGTVRTYSVDPSQRPPTMCTLPLASGQMPFFAFRRLNTAVEQAEFQRLRRGFSNESVVNLVLATGVLRVVISHLDANRDGQALPRTCEEARLVGLEERLCPD